MELECPYWKIGVVSLLLLFRYTLILKYAI
jgi:hypothetical protein